VERSGTALALPSQTTYVAGREPQEGSKEGPLAEGRGALTGLR
jgi:hypothetical protein